MSGINWAEVTAKLPSARTDEAKAARVKIFNAMDHNHNGYLSLTEIQNGLWHVLQLDALSDFKPAIMRAYQAAKNVKKISPTKPLLGPDGKPQLDDKGQPILVSDIRADVVERSEFRLLLVYLQQYFELYAMFDKVDSSDDRRIDLAEFEKAVGLLQTWGVKIPDPAAEFSKIDKNGGGFVLFDEFASWALQHQLDLEEDDD